MLIRYIELYNFRQFQEKQRIEFATDPKKNITIIMGENGTGKTTLAQAFLWVLYGVTEFKNTELINKLTLESLDNNSTTLHVELGLESDGKNYIIRRQQRYIRNGSKVTTSNAILSISNKDKDGKLVSMRADQCQYFINNVLPRELSSFFIFSGERIKDMSDEIQRGKSKEFSTAVKNLVGLNAMMQTLEHLMGGVSVKSASAYSVVGKYNKKIDDVSDQKIKILSSEIEALDNSYKSNKEKLSEAEENIKIYNEELKVYENQLMEYTSLEKDKKLYEDYNMKVKVSEKNYNDSMKSFSRYFSKHSLSFFMTPLINEVREELKSHNYQDKGIPHVHADTILYLLKHKKCLCGNVLQEGSDEEKALNDLLKFVPPQSIGTLVNQHKRYGKSLIKESSTFIEDINNYYKVNINSEKDVNDYSRKADEICERLVGGQELENLKRKRQDRREKLSKLNYLLQTLNRTIGQIESDLNRKIKERDSLISVNNNNKEYLIYRDYATELYKIINNEYSVSEKSVRESLERNINKLFKEILDDGLKLKVDENYNINITVDELNEFNYDIERSTAQNYSVIFAFIASIIEMAKEKKDNNQQMFNKAEGYPLIMDAPLSAFDKRRIKNICTTLPGIANQIIFFIKDTDGQVAEENLGSVLGKKYILEKKSMITTNIKENN